MNYNLPFIPHRPQKTRENGITMVMDKGLSIGQAKDMIDSAGHLIDLVKFGFGTSYMTRGVKEKIDLYKQNNITPYLGGTLFEAFVVRGMFDDFLNLLDEFDLNLAEVSDGSILMDHKEKLEYIEKLAKKVTVLSEVGSKQKGVLLSPDQWVMQMKTELEAGAWKVIAEARESGTVGIYNADGSSNIMLIDYIKRNIPQDHIIWEAPTGKQQIFFIKTIGHNVNLGNIGPDLVVPLETLRVGLRGDTFLDFLPDDIRNKWAQVQSSPEMDFQI